MIRIKSWNRERERMCIHNIIHTLPNRQEFVYSRSQRTLKSEHWVWPQAWHPSTPEADEGWWQFEVRLSKLRWKTLSQKPKTNNEYWHRQDTFHLQRGLYCLKSKSNCYVQSGSQKWQSHWQYPKWQPRLTWGWILTGWQDCYEVNKNVDSASLSNLMKWIPVPYLPPTDNYLQQRASSSRLIQISL